MKTVNSKTGFLLVIVSAAMLRFWGIGFGLPHTECRPDESTIIRVASGFFQGDLNPRFFNYPTLFMYTTALAQGSYAALRVAMGTDVNALMAELHNDRTPLLVIARSLSALCGVMTVILIYWLGRRYFNRDVAISASSLMAVCYLHVRDSHFATTDVPMTFLLLAAILLIFRIASRGRLRDYLLEGAMAGLALSTKYNALFLMFPLFLAHLMARWDSVADIKCHENARGSRHRACFRVLYDIVLDKRIVIAGLAMGGAFVITSPFAVLDYRQFLRDFMYESRQVQVGDWIDLGRGWWYHLRYTLPYGMGWTALAASAGGIILMSVKEPRKALLLFAYPAVYYIVAGRSLRVYVRYMIPVLPFLCLAAAYLLTAIARRMGRHYAPAVLAVLVAVVAAESLSRLVRLGVVLSRPDTRLLAAEWLRTSDIQTSTVYQTGFPSAHIQVPQGLASWYYGEPPTKSRKGPRPTADLAEWNPFVSVPSDAREPFMYIDDAGAYHPVQADALPDLIVVPDSPISLYVHVPSPLSDLLIERYVLIKSFHATRSNYVGRSWYDQLDAFFLPFRGIDRQVRPGPNLRIYERRQR